MGGKSLMGRRVVAGNCRAGDKIFALARLKAKGSEYKRCATRRTSAPRNALTLISARRRASSGGDRLCGDRLAVKRKERQPRA